MGATARGGGRGRGASGGYCKAGDSTYDPSNSTANCRIISIVSSSTTSSRGPAARRLPRGSSLGFPPLRLRFREGESPL